MKRFYLIFLAFFILFACDRQDDSYRQYVVPGGYNYPAKPLEVSARSGYLKVTLSWSTSLDPAVKAVKVFWDNYADSVVVDYGSAVNGRLSTTITDLEDRSYTFDIVNFDGSGNRSLPAEITVAPYGDGWLTTHAERKVTRAQLRNSNAVITMGNPMDEMTATKFRYRNKSGEWVEHKKVLKADDFEISLPDALPGKLIEYQSAYCPENGIDTVWTGNWMKSQIPISYNIDGTRTTVSVTENQINESYAPALILDGIKDDSNSRWMSSVLSSYRGIFPKILVLDTKLIGDNAMTFTAFDFYQDPDPENESRRYIRDISIYVSDTKFNPDDTNYSFHFGDPVLKATLPKSKPEYELALPEPVRGRFIAIVFRTSYSSVSWIDLWELEAYGYVAESID
jgi:hypothetical protein